ncbi:hypothetical protein FA15DRAFT_623280 [Coprinopsis marcescibilis]|uniref:DUF6699 domain-containing protein n=1 Tax=Coprinopsis marcescibilis TaxID=230819 RepID=A0A5C3KNH3_COPMA|nr:hypothetical protein FA15DRAFT_623280 [Coprinopsis marcescibilis]
MSWSPWYPQNGGGGFVPNHAPPVHGFIPPHNQPYPQWGGQAYTDAYGGQPPIAAQYSAKFPTLHPILANDTTKLRFDLKRNPQSEILASTYYSNRNLPAKATPTNKFRIISKSFPWSIDISPPGVNVTVGMVWDALYACLQEPIQDSEWGLIILDKKAKERIEAAAKKRTEADPSSDKRIKRIDYLGDVTLFKGLEKDDDYAKTRLMPTTQAWHDTWLVKLTS